MRCERWYLPLRLISSRPTIYIKPSAREHALNAGNLDHFLTYLPVEDVAFHAWCVVTLFYPERLHQWRRRSGCQLKGCVYCQRYIVCQVGALRVRKYTAGDNDWFPEWYCCAFGLSLSTSTQCPELRSKRTKSPSFYGDDKDAYARSMQRQPWYGVFLAMHITMDFETRLEDIETWKRSISPQTTGNTSKPVKSHKLVELWHTSILVKISYRLSFKAKFSAFLLNIKHWVSSQPSPIHIQNRAIPNLYSDCISACFTFFFITPIGKDILTPKHCKRKFNSFLHRVL